MNIKLIVTAITTALITLGTLQPAMAYTTMSKWDTNRIIMRASRYSFPVGHSFRDALQTVEDRYYINPSEVWFEHRWNEYSVSHGNGQNEVWVSNSPFYAPAMCVMAFDFWTGKIVEADVVFWSHGFFTSSMIKTDLGAYGGNNRPLQTAAIHEYGHAAGLGHEDDEYNIMGAEYNHLHCQGNTVRSYIGEDASQGLMSLYGRYSGGTINDVSATIFRWSGRNGEYSLHDKGKVRRADDDSIPPNLNEEGQKSYCVDVGDVYKFEFTVENNGEWTRTVNVGYYLSTDNHISTSDRLLGWQYMRISANGNVAPISPSIQIPTDLAFGRKYYIGIYVDHTNDLNEVDKLNNTAFHIIRRLN